MLFVYILSGCEKILELIRIWGSDMLTRLLPGYNLAAFTEVG